MLERSIEKAEILWCREVVHVLQNDETGVWQRRKQGFGWSGEISIAENDEHGTRD
jgi:hypothetical protein